MSRRWTGVDYAWAVTGGLVTFVAGGIALLLAAPDAEAQMATLPPNCGFAADAHAQLTPNFGESPLFIGDAGSSQVVVYVNPETETWTIMSIQGEIGCLNASGEGFDTLDLPPAGEPS